MPGHGQRVANGPMAGCPSNRGKPGAVLAMGALLLVEPDLR